MGELYESDIVFSSDSDYDSDAGNRQLDTMSSIRQRRLLQTGKVNRTRSSTASPMAIPTSNFSSSAESSPSSAKAFFRQQRTDLNIFTVDQWLDDYEDDDNDMMVPPHLIVARRISSENSRSGSGGLKGRNLNRVRNSILRMTGFLEQ